MTSSIRLLLVVALSVGAFVALMTAVMLVVARARARRRAPLASALTATLVFLCGACIAGAVAVGTPSRPALITAAVLGLLCAVAISAVGLLRREHAALVGGSAAARVAQTSLRATLRALAASARLGRRLQQADDIAAVEAAVVAAARRAMPETTVTLSPEPELVSSASEVAVACRVGANQTLRARLTDSAPGTNAARATMLGVLAAQAQVAAAHLSARNLVALHERRRALGIQLDERLRSVDDVFGAFRLAAEAAADSAGASWAELTSANGEAHHFAREGGAAASRAELALPVSSRQGVLRLGFQATPAPIQVALSETVAEALSRALAEIDWHRIADQRRARQAAISAAAAVDPRDPASLATVLSIARQALAADGVVAYTIRDEQPAVLAASGIDPPPATDGLAAQSLAAARIVIDTEGAFLADAPVPGMAGGVAAPVPGRSQRGALSVLYRDPPPLQIEDGDDVAAFAQLAALAADSLERERELARREVLRLGVTRISEALAQPRDPAETYAAVAGAATRALRAHSAVVVSGDGDLELRAASTTPAPLIDDQGRAGALLTLAAAEGRIVLCADPSTDRRISVEERRAMDANEHRSVLCVPLNAGDENRVVVGVVWAEPHGANDDDLELATHLAAVAGAAVERAEILASERRGRHGAQELQRIGGLMASNLDAAAVLREIVSQAAALLDADTCVLRLVESDRLVVRAVQGDAADALAGSQTALTGGPTGEVLSRRGLVAVADVGADERFGPDDPLLQARYRAYLGAPILSPDGELRGVLALYDQRRRVWRHDEIEALEAFAASATVALHNALLYQRVAQEKEKSEAIFASIADGIVVVGADGRVEAWNRAAAAMTGVSARSALRRRLPDLLRRELGDLDGAAAIRLAEADEGVTGVELRLNRGDREIWLSVRSARLRDPVEDRVGIVYALRDVSEERQLDQLKSDFVATVSHELRTPLTSIYGFAGTLLRSDVSFAEDDRRTFVSYIATESERLTRLVDGLLSVTRLEAGGVELDLHEIDVGEVLRDVVLRQSERVRETHRFDLALPAEALVAAADRDKLRQIVLNLVDNAIKYSPAGGAITVSAQRRLGMVEIRVQDEGIGISTADQRNLFRKFFRADARMTRGIRGIGLGLYLTRGFVTAMGGRIRVESRQGEGSTFIVDLPLPRGAGDSTRTAAA